MLKSMSISAKLYLAMLMAVGLSLGMAATAYDQLDKVSDRVETLTSKLYDDLAAIDKNNVSLNRILDQRRDVLIQLEDTRNLIIIGSVASFLFFALLAAYLVRNHVVAPVTQLSRLLQDVASTLDFTRRHSHDMNDEFGTASVAFNRLMEETRTALRELSQNTTQVAGGASQASSAIGQVAEGAQV